MKRIAVALSLVFFAVNGIAGETWRKETFESGETAYASGYMASFNTFFLIGERGL